MTRPSREQLRRLSLAALVGVTLILVGSYGVRRWRAQQAREQVSVPVAGDVQQQAEKFTFSRSEEGRTLFTVQAARTIERAGKTTVLEDVVVHIYGQRGERSDVIRTGRCEYDLGGTGRIVCPGEVRIDLGGGSRPPQSATPSIQLLTAALQFDPAEGAAWTDEAVQISFPEGQGEARGLRYQPREPRVKLNHDVALRLLRGGQPVRIQGSQLHYYAGSQVFELVPPLRLERGNRSFTAERLQVELDGNFHTQRIEARGRVQAHGQQDGRKLIMHADRAVALYASDGPLRELRAHGHVEFTGRGGNSEERLRCDEAVFTFEATGRSLERIAARGTARLAVKTPEETRVLSAPVLELAFRGAGGSRQLLTARQRGTLELQGRGGRARRLAGDRIELEFGERQRLRRLVAVGRVETQAVLADGTARRTWSEEFEARFDADGRLAEAEQRGRFRYRDARWQAQAGRARYRGAAGVFVLREQPVVWDASTRTVARLIEVEENTGTLRAEGAVRTTQQPARADVQGFGSREPLQLAAERLHAERERGWMRYEGRVRLWQGKNRLAAEAMELFRGAQKLVAEENVAGLFFPVAEGSPNGPKAANRQRPLRVTSKRFTYGGAERRGVFEGQVTAQNDFGRLTTPYLEIFFAPADSPGARTVERVYAREGVRIEQDGWQANSREAEYRAAEQTVVLWGGSPTISHPQHGTTRGARLTLVLPDDRILIDSAEGARSVTRRPWTQ